MSLFLKRNNKQATPFLLFSFTILTLSMTSILSYRIDSYLFLFIYLLIYILFSFCYFHGAAWKKVLFSLLEPLSLSMIGILVELFLYAIIAPPYHTEQGDFIYSRMRVFITYIILYIIISLVDIQKNKSNRNYKNPYSYAVISIILLSLVSLLSIVGYYRTADFSQTSFENLIAIVFICVLLLVLSTILLYNILIIHLKSEYETKMSLQLHELQEDFFEKLQINSELLVSLRHDLKNHLIAIDGYLAKEQIEPARTYIQNISEKTSSVHSIVTLDNIILSSILTQKKMLCAQQNISFHYNIQMKENLLSDMDLCTVVSNLLDNAIEASCTVTDNRGYIEFSIHEANEILTIHCENNYFTEPVLERGKLLTTKDNRILHGIGLLNIQDLVEKYDGSMEYHFENQVFQIELIFQY